MDELYIIGPGIEHNVFLQYIHNLITPTDYYVNEDGLVWSNKSKRIMTPGTTLKGYLKINLYIDTKVCPVTIHKMVGLTWLKDSYRKGYDIDHINGVKTNNKASNLEWVTRSTNIKRAFATGLKHGVRGDKHPVTVYSEKAVNDAIHLLNTTDMSVHQIADVVKIPASYLYTIFRGESRIFSTENIDRSRIKRFVRHTPEEKAYVCELFKTKTAKEISEITGWTVDSIYSMMYNR